MPLIFVGFKIHFSSFDGSNASIAMSESPILLSVDGTAN